MTAEVDKVRPGESSCCGALLKIKEVANKVEKQATLPEIRWMSCCKTSSVCFRSAQDLDVDCGRTSVVAMRCVMAWPGVAW